MGKASRVRMSGPLVPYAEGFYGALRGQGYTPLSALCHLRLMAHLSRWLATQGLGARDLIPARVGQFLKLRRRQGHRQWVSARGISPLIEHLRRVGAIQTLAATSAPWSSSC